MTTTEIFYLSILLVILIVDSVIKAIVTLNADAYDRLAKEQAEIIMDLQKHVIEIQNKNAHIYIALTQFTLKHAIENDDYETAAKCRGILKTGATIKDYEYIRNNQKRN